VNRISAIKHGVECFLTFRQPFCGLRLLQVEVCTGIFWVFKLEAVAVHPSCLKTTFRMLWATFCVSAVFGKGSFLNQQERNLKQLLCRV
jgi:hypothetical protein